MRNFVQCSFRYTSWTYTYACHCVCLCGNKCLYYIELTLDDLMELPKLIPVDNRNSLDHDHWPIPLEAICPIRCLCPSSRVLGKPMKLKEN